MAKDLRQRRTETEPLKWKDAENLLKLLNADGDYQNLLFFACGFSFGLRIGDLLKLKWEDLYSDEFAVKEGKTGKFRDIRIGQKLRNIISKVLKTYRSEPNPDEYVFTSQRIKSSRLPKKPITVHAANHRIKKVFDRYGIRTKNASSHTLRKTFARRIWENNNRSDAALIEISELLGHVNTKVTRTYIGVTQERIKDIYKNLW